MTKDEVLAELAAAMAARSAAEARIFAAVDTAASAGATWDDIGRALGTSGQAAWDWLHPVTDGPEPMPQWFVAAKPSGRPR